MTHYVAAALTVAALTAAYLWAMSGTHAEAWDTYEVDHG